MATSSRKRSRPIGKAKRSTTATPRTTTGKSKDGGLRVIAEFGGSIPRAGKYVRLRGSLDDLRAVLIGLFNGNDEECFEIWAFYE